VNYGGIMAYLMDSDKKLNSPVQSDLKNLKKVVHSLNKSFALSNDSKTYDKLKEMENHLICKNQKTMASCCYEMELNFNDD